MDITDIDGFNCLYYAVYYGHLEICELLKQHKIEYARDHKGTTCLHVAVQRGFLDIVNFFCKKTLAAPMAISQNHLEKQTTLGKAKLQAAEEKELQSK